MCQWVIESPVLLLQSERSLVRLRRGNQNTLTRLLASTLPPSPKGSHVAGMQGGNQALAVMFALCVKCLYAMPVIFLEGWFNPCSIPGFPYGFRATFHCGQVLISHCSVCYFPSRTVTHRTVCISVSFFFPPQRQSEMIRISISEHLFSL